MLFHVTKKSANIKTGDILVTTTDEKSCPPACPFKGSGCYADSGPLKLHWSKVSRGERGGSLDSMCDAIRDVPEGMIWRYGQAGDLPGEGNRIAPAQLHRVVEANQGRSGYAYTHKPMSEANQRAVSEANSGGFTINLSANNLEHADELTELGVAPVVTVLPSDASGKIKTPAGRRVLICPATQRDDVTCKTCRLCSRRSPKRPIIGFPAHGTGKKRASAIAES